MNKLNEIADYAEDHDFAAEMKQGTWEANNADPMITTSVRLPSRCWTGSGSAPPRSMCVRAR